MELYVHRKHAMGAELAWVGAELGSWVFVYLVGPRERVAKFVKALEALGHTGHFAAVNAGAQALGIWALGWKQTRQSAKVFIDQVAIDGIDSEYKMAHRVSELCALLAGRGVTVRTGAKLNSNEARMVVESWREAQRMLRARR